MTSQAIATILLLALGPHHTLAPAKDPQKLKRKEAIAIVLSQQTEIETLRAEKLQLELAIKYQKIQIENLQAKLVKPQAAAKETTFIRPPQNKEEPTFETKEITIIINNPERCAILMVDDQSGKSYHLANRGVEYTMDVRTKDGLYFPASITLKFYKPGYKIYEESFDLKKAETEPIKFDLYKLDAPGFDRFDFLMFVRKLHSYQIPEVLGKPYRTSESGGTKYFYYSGLTYDEASEKLDRTIQIVADDYGESIRVNFN